MLNDIKEQISRDLSDFLSRYHIEKIGEIPIEAFVVFEFPRIDQKSEHSELSRLVADLMRFERIWATQKQLHGRLDEHDLVRKVPDQSMKDWLYTEARPALIRLALLDCRERLARLVRLSGEEENQAAVERLINRRHLEPPATLGELSALVLWLRQDIADIHDLTSRIVEFPVHLLPQPSWALFSMLKENFARIEEALEDSSYSDNLDYLESFLSKWREIDEIYGRLSNYGEVFDFLHHGSSLVLLDSGVAKYRSVRRLLERALEYASVNEENYGEDFPNFRVTLEEAFRLVDSNNALWEFIGSEIFRPEDWKVNRDALRPLFLKAPHMSFWLRSGLTEMVHAFVFGHWVAVQALSRALLEQAISLNHTRLQIDLKEPNGYSKSLDKLIDEVKQKFPQIENEMDIVRRYGNSVLHASDNQFPTQCMAQRMAKMRRDAIESMESLYTVLETLPKLAR